MASPSIYIGLDSCDGSCNNVDNPFAVIFALSDKLCVPKKKENLNIKKFNISWKTG